MKIEKNINIPNFETRKMFFKMSLMLEHTLYTLFPKQKLLKLFFRILISRLQKKNITIRFETHTHVFIHDYKV